MKLITLLGATGSIGSSTLAVVAQHPDKFKLYAVSGQQRLDELLAICQRFKPELAAVPADKALEFQQRLVQAGLATQVLAGVAGLEAIASHAEVDTVVAAIVGAAGLLPTMAAVTAGKRVLLANKEALVMSGSLFMQAVDKHQATLLPIDSEHNAIFQCLPANFAARSFAEQGIEKLLLTASGGPFLGWSKEKLAQVTPQQALAHPNWSMGQKISIDSATLMNKGLELIEACWLFNVQPQQIEVVVHPQSLVHSLVSYVDGSLLAQLGNPDMRTPLAHALAWPERISSGVAPLDLLSAAALDFMPPDIQAFPCLRLAQEAFVAGGTAPTVLNAANEVAVAAFLQGRLGFNQIPELISRVLDLSSVQAVNDLASLMSEDRLAQQLAQQVLAANYT